MSTQPKTFLTPEQYLAVERKALHKSEYFRGELFAMAGAGERHNLLSLNFAVAIHQQLRGRPCRAYVADMRVLTSPAGLYTYPDIVTVCGERRFVDDQLDTLVNPTLIAEVLSPSTEAYDRGRKFELYRTIETLEEYLLVAADRVHVELYTRQPEGRWLLSEASRLEDVLDLKSIACKLSLADLYDKTDLENEAA
ncbi:MAG: Uma2 family endonuclease [Bryobacteraceae bacterium]